MRRANVAYLSTKTPNNGILRRSDSLDSPYFKGNGLAFWDVGLLSTAPDPPKWENIYGVEGAPLVYHSSNGIRPQYFTVPGGNGVGRRVAWWEAVQRPVKYGQGGGTIMSNSLNTWSGVRFGPFTALLASMSAVQSTFYIHRNGFENDPEIIGSYQMVGGSGFRSFRFVVMPNLLQAWFPGDTQGNPTFEEVGPHPFIGGKIMMGFESTSNASGATPRWRGLFCSTGYVAEIHGVPVGVTALVAGNSTVYERDSDGVIRIVFDHNSDPPNNSSLRYEGSTIANMSLTSNQRLWGGERLFWANKAEWSSSSNNWGGL